jgi:hypothetical protein
MFYVLRGSKEIKEIPADRLRPHPERPDITVFTNKSGKEFNLFKEDLFSSRPDAEQELGLGAPRTRRNHSWDFRRLEIGERLEIPRELRSRASNAARFYKYRMKKTHGITWEFKIFALPDRTVWLQRVK